MNVEDVVSRLGHRDPHERYQVLKSLVGCEADQFEAPVVESLVKVCRGDRQGYNRNEALKVLRVLWPRPEVVEAFRERLGDETCILETATEILGEIADPQALRLLLDSYQAAKQVRQKLHIIRSLAQAPQPAIFGFLQATRAHESSEDRIRATVVSLLARLRNPTLKSVFFKALQDTTPRVRANAVEALDGVCEGKELVAALATLAKDRSNRVRANAIRSLLALGVRQAEPLLHEMIHHQNPRYRSSAAWVLGEVGDRVSNGRELLERLAQDADNNVIYRAQQSTGRLPPAPSLRILAA